MVEVGVPRGFVGLLMLVAAVLYLGQLGCSAAGRDIQPSTDLAELAGESESLFAAIAPSYPVLQVGAQQELRILEGYPLGGVRVISDDVTWTSSDRAVGDFDLSSPSLFNAKSPGTTIVMAVVGDVMLETEVCVYTERAAVDGDLADWEGVTWCRVPEALFSGKPIEIHIQGQGRVDAISASESKLFPDPEGIHTQGIAIRYTLEAVEIAIRNWLRIDPSVGIWISFHFYDSSLDRMLLLPQGDVAAPGQSFAEVGADIPMEYAFGVSALEIVIPWSKLGLKPSMMRGLKDVVVTFHEPPDSAGEAEFIELVNYKVPSRFATNTSLDPDSVITLVAEGSTWAVTPGSQASWTFSLLDGAGLLREIRDYELVPVSNCTQTGNNLSPVSDGTMAFEISWNGMSRAVEALALSTGTDSDAVGLRYVRDEMPLEVSLYLGARSAAEFRRHWLVRRTMTLEEVLGFAGPWDGSAEYTHTLTSNRDALECVVLLEGPRGVRYLVEKSFELPFEVGSSIRLNATPLQVDRQRDWVQVFGGPATWEYVTGNPVQLMTGPTGEVSFVPDWPGVYRFSIGGKFVDVLVSMESQRSLEVRGLIFPDYYGEWDRSHVVDQATFEWAAQHALDLGANTISIVNFAHFTSIRPLPTLEFIDMSFSLNQSELADLVGTCDDRDLGFILSIGQSAYPFITGIEPTDVWAAIGSASYSWWKRWFSEFGAVAVEQARIASTLGIDRFQVLEDRGQSLTYTSECEQLLSDVREVFPGAVGSMSYRYGLEKPEFYGNLDFFMPYVATFGGFPISRLPNPREPTIGEIRSRMLEYFAAIKRALGSEVDSIDVFPVLNVCSVDGQNRFQYAEPLPVNQMDLNEQVLYYEAFFQAVYQTPWIDGVIVRGPTWFDEVDFDKDYFDTYAETLFTGKPAEDVVRLWFSIFGGWSPAQEGGVQHQRSGGECPFDGVPR